jgi:hypothetical protein
VLFRKTNPAKQMSERKKERNVVYTACGYTILVCIGLIIVDVVFFRDSVLQTIDPVFWLESAAVIAFGVSWLTKGETILADVVSDPQAPRPGVPPVEPTHPVDSSPV